MKGERKKSLSAGIVINLVATFLIRAISIVTAPITTRLLETSDYGSMSVFTTWVEIMAIVLGMQTFGTLTNAHVKYETKDEFFRYSWNTFLLSFLGHLAGLAIILPFIGTVSGWLHLTPFLILLMIAQSFLQNTINILSGYFIIENKAGYNMILSGILSVGSFGLSVLLVKVGAFPETPYMAFIIGHFIITVLCGAGVVVWLYRKGVCKIRKDYVTYCLGLSLPLIFHALSGIVLGQSDRLMLERMVDLSEAGVYSLTYNFSNILLTIWGAVNAIWVPFYFRYLKAGDNDELKHHVKNFDILFLVLFSGFLLLSPEVFRIMDERYWYQMDIMPVLIAGFFFNHLYGYPANYEFYKEKTTYLAAASIGTAILNIGLNLLLIPRWYAMGAAVATSLSFVISYLFHAVAARCFVKGYPLSLSGDLLRLIPAGAATGLFYLAKDLPAVRWGAGIAIGILYIVRMIRRKEIL